MSQHPAEPFEPLGPAQRKQRRWMVVSYDIPDDRRRTKIMKTLAGYGHRVQYSVFECELRPSDRDELVQRLRRLLAEEEDDIRFYPLCESCLRRVHMLGRARRYEQPDYRIV